MAGRYDNPPRGKRSSSDPTMTQQANSAASKKAGEDDGKKAAEIDITDTKGPTPELDAGTEAIPVTARQAGERADMYARHGKEMQSTHTQYEKALRDMRSRQESEIASMMKRHDGEAGAGGGA